MGHCTWFTSFVSFQFSLIAFACFVTCNLVFLLCSTPMIKMLSVPLEPISFRLISPSALHSATSQRPDPTRPPSGRLRLRVRPAARVQVRVSHLPDVPARLRADLLRPQVLRALHPRLATVGSRGAVRRRRPGPGAGGAVRSQGNARCCQRQSRPAGGGRVAPPPGRQWGGRGLPRQGVVEVAGAGRMLWGDAGS